MGGAQAGIERAEPELAVRAGGVLRCLGGSTATCYQREAPSHPHPALSPQVLSLQSQTDPGKKTQKDQRFPKAGAFAQLHSKLPALHLCWASQDEQ